jgi:photosystem I subunit X
MISSILMTAVEAQTTDWSLGVAITMILCNLFVISIGRFAIKERGKGPELPISPSSSGLFEGFGVPELLATTSLGHILGAGMILGMANAGVF